MPSHVDSFVVIQTMEGGVYKECPAPWRIWKETSSRTISYQVIPLYGFSTRKPTHFHSDGDPLDTITLTEHNGGWESQAISKDRNTSDIPF